MRARSCAVADAVGDNDGLLEVGETWAYTAAHTVTQAEIDSNGGGDGTSTTWRRRTATRPVRTPTTPRCRWRRPGAEHRQGARCRGRPRMSAGETHQLHDHGSEHRQHDADRRGGDRSVCGCGLDRARRRRGRRQRRLARGRRDLGLHGGAHGDAGRDRQQRRRRRRHGEHCDGGQHRDRSGHRRRDGAGGADRGAEHHEGRPVPGQTGGCRRGET